MKNTVLKIENLNISFTQYYSGMKMRNLNIIKNLNLETYKNEILAIFGASGSGKSLLAHFMLGLLPKNALVSGNMYYNGKKIDSSNIKRLQKDEICFIPQTVNSLNPLLKIKDQAEFFSINRIEKSQIYEKLDCLFERFHLDKKVLNMYPHELSGGMARKTIVLLSMIVEKNLIIADEPTPGMDNTALNETVKFFKDLKRNGKSAVVITHDMETALKFADRIAVFYNGQIVETAPVSAFSGRGENLKHEFSKNLWNSLPENEFLDLNLKEGKI